MNLLIIFIKSLFSFNIFINSMKLNKKQFKSYIKDLTKTILEKKFITKPWIDVYRLENDLSGEGPFTTVPSFWNNRKDFIKFHELNNEGNFAGDPPNNFDKNELAAFFKTNSKDFNVYDDEKNDRENINIGGMAPKYPNKSFNKILEKNKDYVYGCLDKKQFIDDWFNEKIIIMLLDNNFKCFKYRTNRYVISKINKQVLFNRKFVSSRTESNLRDYIRFFA